MDGEDLDSNNVLKRHGDDEAANLVGLIRRHALKGHRTRSRALDDVFDFVREPVAQIDNGPSFELLEELLILLVFVSFLRVQIGKMIERTATFCLKNALSKRRVEPPVKIENHGGFLHLMSKRKMASTRNLGRVATLVKRLRAGTRITKQGLGVSMRSQERSALVKETASELGFERCGITAARPIQRASFLTDWLERGYAGTMGYLHRHTESRVDVAAWLPWAKSIVVVALNYHQNRRDPPLEPIAGHGRIAMYAWGEDYHVVLREKLELLLKRIEEHFGGPFKSKICVDTSAIVERELAASAGIGWIGKNTMVLHQNLGSYFFLGEIITDLDLAPDMPEPDHCGTCTRCLDACPTDAFPEPYVMDASRCISYLTIEHRGEIEPNLAEKMEDWVFGCDVCQMVCPYNQDIVETNEPGFQADNHDAGPSLDDILAWDQSAYLRAVKGKATSRAKLHMWHRNAEIAKRNLEQP